MKKLKLDLSELRVESFESSAQPGQRGTVQGHVSDGSGCYYTACAGPATCLANHTCDGAIGKCFPYSGVDC
jgi:hypothetical protein